jgi:hypothetical protein
MNFDTWLNTATQNLPINRLEAIRQELTGHYLDAVDDYLLQGLSPDNARVIALRELGDARAVCDGLRSVHIHRREYWRAMVIACMPTACVMLFLPMVGQIRRNDEPLIALIYTLFIAISAIMTVWATRHSIRMTSMIAYLGDEADMPISLINIGLWIMLVMTIINLYMSRTIFIAIINAPTFIYSSNSPLNNPSEIIISIVSAFGMMVTGIGWILYGDKLASTTTHKPIFSLLRILMLIMGVALILLSTGAILQDYRLTAISTTISLIFGILTFSLFIILFYQMGRNTPPSRPSLA